MSKELSKQKQPKEREKERHALMWRIKNDGLSHGEALDLLRSEGFLPPESADDFDDDETGGNIEERMNMVQELLAKGLITEEEAAKKRQAILDEI